jgi:hypothetical protein
MRRVVAEHPIVSFLIIGYGVYVAIALTPALREAELWFELPLFGSLGSIFGVGLAAFLVTAAADGRAGVVIAWAVAVIVATGGRFASRRDEGMGPALTPT